MKYAFIMNSRTLNPESYSVRYEDGENQYYFTAVHGMKMTREVARKLSDEGYGLIDLCGNYNEEKADEIRKVSEGKVIVNYAKYTEEELAKLEALDSMGKFGIIVLGFDLSKDVVKLELTSDEFNTYITIVAKEEISSFEAQRMVAEGIDFIELCGYFNAEKAAVVAEAIGHKVPLGYCG